MYSLTVDFDTTSNKEKVALVVPVTSVKVKVRGDACCKFLYFVVKVSDKKNGKVSTGVNRR